METIEAHANLLRILARAGAFGPPPQPVSHMQIAAWRRHEQRLSDIITELTKERDELREKLRNVESR